MRVVAGVLLTVLAAALMVIAPAPLSAPITLVVVGVVLIATSHSGRHHTGA